MKSLVFILDNSFGQIYTQSIQIDSFSLSVDIKPQRSLALKDIDVKTLKRKIVLKSQGIQLMRSEIQSLRDQLYFIKTLARYHRQITQVPNPVLSKKIECLVYLLED